MGLKIVNQTNEQECGVCALTALHNFYYREQIDKEQVLEQSHISQEGMTIFDFEQLGKELGIDCESYEVKFSEFINLKINSYFVLLVMTQNGSSNHFVVARKKNNYVEVYDSCSMQILKLSYAELEKVYMNVVILVNKKPNQTFVKVFGSTKTLLMFDLKFVLLNLGLSILILALSMGTASFLNFIIDLAISKGSINNLITISFIFVLIYFANDLLSYVSNLYMSRHIKNYFLLFTGKILSGLETKKLDFLHKVDKNWVFKVDECVYNISNFCVVEVNKFITSIIFCVACICVIGSLQYYLLIFVMLHALLELIFFLFSYRKKKEIFLNVVRSENNNAQYYKHLIASLANEVWFTKRKNIIQRIKDNYSNIYKNYHDVVIFKSNTSLFKSLLKSFFEICIIALMAVLIIKTNTMTIGKLTFVVSAFALYRNASSDLFNYFLSKIEFDVYWQVYKDLTIVGGVVDSKSFSIDEKINSISFINDNISVVIGNKQSNHISIPFIELIKGSKEIRVNGKKIDCNKSFWNSIVVLDQQTTTDTQLLIKQIGNNPMLYSQYVQYFNLDLNKEQQSFYDSLIINLLTLLNEQNKIIFIDDIFRYINHKDLLVVKQITNKIKKNNTVFVLGKEEND
ncbi:MAG: cysteine peptidase family C39 domain-containing protein [Mycoplasmoidaceae bacterium]